MIISKPGTKTANHKTVAAGPMLHFSATAPRNGHYQLFSFNVPANVESYYRVHMNRQEALELMKRLYQALQEEV